MGTWFIYSLSKNGVVFYIGKTDSLNRRHREHMKVYGNDIAIEKLHEINCSLEDAFIFESKIIKEYLDKGFILENSPKEYSVKIDDKCLNCGSNITKSIGKRTKLYCSDNCRASFNQKKKNKTKSICLSDWVKLESGELPPEWVEKYFKKYPDRIPKTTSPAPGDQLDKQPSTVTSEKKHSLWKEGDPREGTMAFMRKYDCNTYDELQNKK